MNLCEKYRPRVLADIVGQDKAVRKVQHIIGRALADPRPICLFIQASGVNNSGIGKTTLALAAAAEVADQFFTTETIGTRLTKTAVREMANTAQLYAGCGKRYRAWIVNEAHSIPKDAVDELLEVLETVPDHFFIAFTTTKKPESGLFGENNGPFYSRCSVITLTNQGVAQAFADRAREIAHAEGLDGQPPAAYLKLARDCGNNMRAMIQRIDDGDMME